MPDPCPCGSGAPYGDCCGPVHRRVVDPSTATELMRARYSAFARRDETFLLDSWHPEHRPASVEFPGDEQWLGLEVLAATAGGAEDDRGTVEFRAHFVVGGVPRTLHEVSRFVRLDGRWVYLKGRDVGHMG